tara:strand:- start:479 stop:1033 length:555 start_codon:yes stop_codon:yes gene_type:complete
MTRSIDAATITALQSDAIRLCHLIQIDFPTVTKITDNYHAVEFEGDDFEPVGHLLKIGQPQETQELRVGTVKLTLSGVDQAYISIFLSQTYINRRVRIWKAVLDDAGQIIGDAIITFDGQVTGYGIQDGEQTSTIDLSCASHWADFERKAGRLTNINSQQYFFPADTGFRYAANSMKDIKWGKA